ncbi:MAG: Panacea domain-containing protein [Sulfuricella sp.]
MPIHIKHFDRDKALEVILFIAKSLQGAATFHSISKMLYLSDKLHLQEYGRLICGDRYIAMEYGPVPSAIYDMMKVANKRATIDVDWDEIIQDAMGVAHGRNVVPNRDCNMDMLSESELECIQQTISEFGGMSFGQLVDITHDSAWNAVEENETISVDAIVATLPNAAEVAGYLHAH